MKVDDLDLQRQLGDPAVYADNDPVLWTSYATTLQTLEDAGYPAADSYLLITIDDAADATAVQEEVEGKTTDLPTVTVKDQAGFAEEQRAPIDQMLLLIYALLAIGCVIALLPMVWMVSASIMETGAANQYHTHPGAFWSAVYYVDDGYEGSADDALGGELILLDPRMPGIAQNPAADECTTSASGIGTFSGIISR